MEYTFNEVAERVDREIKDENLKRLLFGSKHPEGDDIMGIGVTYRMLVFTFLYTFSKYKFFQQKKNAKAGNSNANRVFDAFACIFNGEDVCFDLIMYVLTEMQIDAISNGKKSFFAGIFSSNEDSLQIPAIRQTIKTWLHSAKLATQDNAVLLRYFLGMYEALDVLRNVEVIPVPENPEEKIEAWKNKKKYTFRFKPTGEGFGSYELFFVDKEDNELYYLNSYENVAGNNSLLSYHTLDGGNIQKLELPTVTFLRASQTTNNGTMPKAIFAKSLFSIGFKYIKNLSFAVCDTITRATKQKIYEHFSLKYSDVFELGLNKKWYDIDWDNVLTILMFEEGPSNVLELVLDSEGIYFDKILTNLELRYNTTGFVAKVKESYDVEQSKEMEMIRRYSDDQSSIIKNIASINKTLMAKSILDGLAELENNKVHSNSRFVESLPMRINSITKVTMSNLSMSDQVIKINRALEKTFRYIIPFYEGLIAFQLHKDDKVARFEASGGGFLDRNQLFKECEEKFLQRAKESAVEVSRASLGILVDIFRKLASSLSEKEGHRIVITPAGKALKSAIGRSYLCSVKTFNNILSMESPYRSPEQTAEKPITDIVAFINEIKHHKGRGFSNILQFKDFIHQVKELLYFFVYNEDYEREMIIGQQISYDPIYPYVVRYTERSENRDGYNINSFSIFFDADNGEKEVKILSDRDYDINEKYYCVPNVTMSNSRWWIEPFLINCREYDKIINDAIETAISKGEIED